jgi:hypothetical protein
MPELLAAALVAANLTAYQGFGDRGIGQPGAADRNPSVEATVDRGPIVELILRCPKGTAIVSYAKLERLFCSPRLVCGPQLGPIIARSCR